MRRTLQHAARPAGEADSRHEGGQKLARKTKGRSLKPPAEIDSIICQKPWQIIIVLCSLWFHVLSLDHCERCTYIQGSRKWHLSAIHVRAFLEPITMLFATKIAMKQL